MTPAPAWGAVLQTAASNLQAAARAAAAAALLALPLIAMARPFRAQQVLPSATAATSAAATAATAAASKPAAAAATTGGVLLNDSLSQVELRQMCSAVQQRLAGQVWLSSKQAQVDAATAASILGSSSSSNNSRRCSSDKLVYQVVLDATGRVLGVSPCTPEAAAVVWELPIAVDLRGSDLAKVHERWVAPVPGRKGAGQAGAVDAEAL